jgi:DnaJ-class molecular chaperone
VGSTPRTPTARRRLRGGGESGESGGESGGAQRSDDLEAEVTLSLREALSGFSRTVLHPGDGREVAVAAAAIGAPGAELVVKGAGMPRRSAAARSRQRVAEDGASVVEMQTPELAAAAAAAKGSGGPRRPAEYGDLRVRLALALPASLTEAQQHEVDRIFPSTPEERAQEARAKAVMRAGDGEEVAPGGEA